MEVLVRGCVVFDLDGTLIDSAPLCADILNAMLAARGERRRLTPEQTRPHVIAGGRRMIGAVLGVAEAEADLAMEEFRNRYAATPTPGDLMFAGAREALESLKANGWRLAIWTNKPQPLTDKTVTDLGLSPLFAAVVGSGPHAPLKPDPLGFDLALQRAGATREMCCYVGDSEVDVEVARVAGVPMVLMTHGYGDYSRIWPGVAIAGSFAALPAMIEAAAPVQVA